MTKLELHKSAICLNWSDILEELLKYINSEIPPYSNKLICRNFLSYVEKHYPDLTPYRTFRLCEGRGEALCRRVDTLLQSLAEKLHLEAWDNYLYRPGCIAERIAIWVDDEESKSKALMIGLWPANTVSQATRFYDCVDKERLFNLKDWEVKPDLHLNFISTKLISFNVKNPDLEGFFDHFAKGNSYGRIDREDLSALAKEWKKKGFITSEDQKKIEKDLLSRRYPTFNVIPGFSVYWTRDLDSIIDLEERGCLEDEIIDDLGAPLSSWREML